MREVAIPNSDWSKVGTRGINENAVGGVVRKDRVVRSDSGPRSGVEAVGAAGQADVVERDRDFISRSTCKRVDGIQSVVPDDCISDV